MTAKSCLSILSGGVLAVGAIAEVPNPIVVWDGDFDVLTKGSCTLTVGTGSSVSADGSTITIGSTEGVKVSWGTGRRNYTAIVRYRDFTTPSTSSGAVLAGHANGSLSGVMMTNGGKVQGMYSGRAYTTVTPPVACPIAEGSAGHYAMAFSVDSMAQWGNVKGQALYVKTSEGEWQHLFTNAGAIATSTDVNIKGCVVAGPCPDSDYTPSTMAGMKLEAIAVFPGALTVEQVSEYRFPVDTCSVEISSAGSYAWADLPWRNAKVPVGDVSSNAVEIVCNVSATITDATLAVTAATIRCSGTGTLTFAGVAEFGTKETGSIEMNLATSGDGALTLTEGDWYLGRQVAGYKNFTITGSNPLTLCANATLAIYDGKIGSPVAGWGTIRSIDLLPRKDQLDVALTNAVLWHGNCVLEEIDNTQYALFDPDTYGNETSKITFNGFKNRYFKFISPIPTEDNTPTFKPEMAVKDHTAAGYGLQVRGGATGAIAKIRKMSGDGTIFNPPDDNIATSPNHLLLIQDWGNFTGSVEINSKMRVVFGASVTGSGISGNGIVVVRSGAPLSLGARSKIHGWLDSNTGATVVQGTLSVVSGKSLCGGRVSLAAAGELIFDADKAQVVSDATLTDCSNEDMSAISGSGLVRFKGTYSPFILPSEAESNLVSSLNIRIDGATVNGDLSVASRFGGSGSYGGGTLTFLDGAVLDLTWGTLAFDTTADLAAPPATFMVVADNSSIATNEIKMFSGTTVPAAWQGVTVKVISPNGLTARRFKTVLRSDGLYAVAKGMAISFL